MIATPSHGCREHGYVGVDNLLHGTLGGHGVSRRDCAATYMRRNDDVGAGTHVVSASSSP